MNNKLYQYQGKRELLVKFLFEFGLVLAPFGYKELGIGVLLYGALGIVYYFGSFKIRFTASKNERVG